MQVSAAATEWLQQAIGSTESLSIKQLQGATSSSVFLVQTMDSARKYVLRVINNPRWLADEPDLAEHEAAALEEVQRDGLATPRLLAFTSELHPFGAPAVLMSFLEGQIVLLPDDRSVWLRQLAHQLASIHRHPATGLHWQFRSWVDHTQLQPPAWSTQPQLWEQALAIFRQPAPDSRMVLLHRDYHPTNVLWQHDSISGVVDWINACRGPAGVDLAHCRMNLALMFGPGIAEQFLRDYCVAAPEFVYHPYWDIDAMFNCLPSPTFYPPWRTFGLAPIPEEYLQQRVDAYLALVLQKR